MASVNLILRQMALKKILLFQKNKPPKVTVAKTTSL